MRIPINEATLKRMVAREEYWSARSPERSALTNWVGEGFAAIEDGGAASSGTVFVRAYQRSVRGKVVEVSAHERSAGPGGQDARPRGSTGQSAPSSAPPIHQVGWTLFLGARPPVRSMERVPNQTGREAARDVPSWARGTPRQVGESPTTYAERVLDNQHGSREAWDTGRSARGPRSDFSKIRKFGERAFQLPRGANRPPEL